MENFLVLSSVVIFVLESSSLEFLCGVGGRDLSLVTGIRSFSMAISRTVVLGLVHTCELVLRLVVSTYIAHRGPLVDGMLR